MTNEINKALRPAGLAHIVLQSSRYEEMVQWYQDFLGADVIFKNEGMAFLQYDYEHHRIAIFNSPNLKDQTHQGNGVHHFAFSYSTLPSLMEAYKLRKTKGIKPWWSTNHGLTMSMYYADPDKNRIENQVDIFDSAEEASAYMRGPEYEENPIGVDFDPEDVIKRLAAGEPVQEITKRVSIGPRDASSIPTEN